MLTGVLAHFSVRHGYGLIEPDGGGPAVTVWLADLPRDDGALRLHDRVEFLVCEDRRTVRLRAVEVRRLAP